MQFSSEVIEDGQFGRDLPALARVAVEGLGGGALAVAAQVHRGGVEIVDAVLEGEVHQAVDFVLVDDIAPVGVFLHRPAHAAVAEGADARVVLEHLSLEFLVALEVGGGHLFGRLGGAGGNTERRGAHACRFQKVSSVHRAYAFWVWCTEMPRTVMALIGRDGHRFSQAPQPMHWASATVGTGNCAPSVLTIRMAPDGQW